MRTLLVILSLASSCLAQDVRPAPANPQEEQDPAAQLPSTIIVPAGTHLQLALANPLRVTVARVGDTVRAVTTFPVTVEKDLAIPQGAFLEGRIVRVGKRGSTRFDGLQIQFQHLYYANGYHVALDSSVVEARAIVPDTQSIVVAGPLALMATGLQQPPTPTPPPLPQLGPSKALVTGVGIAAMVGIMATVAYLGHRRAHEQGRDFDTGFQFEIVLDSPLTLDSARVAAALAATGGR